ncbi:MAG: hypothetical protein ACK4KT_08230 [Thermaurantimonas sp.]
MAQNSKSWVYECRYLCSQECRGRMYMEGVDIKCACEECMPMLSCFEGGQLTAIYAGRRAMEEVQKAGQFFYHYVDELNSFIHSHWPNIGYQISRVEYHLTKDSRYVKYFLESIDGKKTAVAFKTDKKSKHYQIRCRKNCPMGAYLKDIHPRPQEYCSERYCKSSEEYLELQQF